MRMNILVSRITVIDINGSLFLRLSWYYHACCVIFGSTVIALTCWISHPVILPYTSVIGTRKGACWSALLRVGVILACFIITFAGRIARPVILPNTSVIGTGKWAIWFAFLNLYKKHNQLFRCLPWLVCYAIHLCFVDRYSGKHADTPASWKTILMTFIPKSSNSKWL